MRSLTEGASAVPEPAVPQVPAPIRATVRLCALPSPRADEAAGIHKTGQPDQDQVEPSQVESGQPELDQVENQVEKGADRLRLGVRSCAVPRLANPALPEPAS